MTAIETDDLVIITRDTDNPVPLLGELARVIKRSNTQVYVYGFESHYYGYLPVSAVTALSEVQRDNGAWDDFRFDSEDEEYARLNGVHDYIYEEDE